MVYKRFSVGVAIRIGLILANMVCLAYIFARTDLFFSQLVLLLLLIFQVYNLVQFVTRTSRNLARFLQAIRHHDFSLSFSDAEPANPAFQELHQSFQSVIDAYKEVEARKESQYQYFRLIMEHVPVGIISLNSKDEVVLMNKAAEKLLHVQNIVSWKQLQTRRTVFTQAADYLLRGGRNLAEIVIEEEQRQFAVSVNPVILMGEPYRIITFSDIKNEIESKELEAWHKLIRILTHEIMNSVTPLASLTETMLMILEQEEGNQKPLSEITEENIADIRFSLKTIQKRSSGMLHFLDDYRQLTRIPVPRIAPVNVAGLFASVAGLMQGEINKYRVNICIRPVPPDVFVQADARLLEQVLLNLLTNSLQAMEGVLHPQIELKAFQKDAKLLIEVTDNGQGIEADKLGKIFIPFYSTKASGSGIGLPVCKQIMHLHGGSLRVQSQKGVGTKVELQFPLNQYKDK
jgi:two-component system, NtrC family, nitrogen regulation sensor histidine kinase NtrY